MNQDPVTAIRKAFRETGWSLLELSRRSGVSYSRVHDLIVSGRDVRLSTAAAIYTVLGLELRPARRGRQKA